MSPSTVPIPPKATPLTPNTPTQVVDRGTAKPAEPDVTTPSDEAVLDRKGPSKQQRRYKLFEDGGDYRLLVVADGSDPAIPRGALMPVPASVCGGFSSTAEVKKFVRNSGDLFANKQLMILRAIEILRCDVEVKPVVKVSFKPRKQVSGPPAE